MDKNATLVVRLPADVKAALQKMADEDRRTLSGMVVKLLADALQEAGALRPAKSKGGRK